MDRTNPEIFKSNPIRGVDVSLPDTDPFLTVDESCELLKIGRNAMYSLLRSGAIRAFRNGRVWRIPREGGIGRETQDIWGETFDAGPGTDGIVAVRHVPFYSMCEHHLVPFFGEVNIAYLPAPCGVAGFSKFTKLVEIISHRPQIQERMTGEIAEAIAADLRAQGVLVTVEAQQLCMTMRGDLAHGTRTVTSFSTGRFREDAALRQQAWNLLGKENK